METWACPNDRQLALRAKLGAGWSIHSSKTSPFGKSDQLTAEETEKIIKVIRQAEKIDQVEMVRIGYMVDKLENMKNNAMGNGRTQCLLCGDEFRLLGASTSTCSDCHKCMCSKCGIETVNSKLKAIHLCKICSENRELWRKSGAWFYKGLPCFLRPPSSKRQDNSNKLTLSNPSLRLSNRSLSNRSSPKGSSMFLSNPTNNNQPDDSNSSTSLAKPQNSQGASMVVHSTPNHGGQPGRFGAPGFSRFMRSGQNNRGNDSDSSSDDEVNIIRKRVRPQESDSDSDTAINESAENSSQSEKSRDDRLAMGDKLPDTHLNMIEMSRPSNEHDTITDTTTSQISNNSNNNTTNDTNNTTTITNNNNKSGYRTGQRPSLVFNNLPLIKDQSFERVTSDDEFNSIPETPASLGMLEFSLSYNSKEKLLKCIIHRAKNLPAMDKNGFSDPYVKLHLLPGIAKATKRRTKTILKTRNPEWNETLEYHGVADDDMKLKTLRLSVYDEDKIGSDFIGETRVALKSLVSDLVREFSVYLSGLQVKTSDHTEDGSSPEDRGRILIGLMHSTVGEKLVVSIKRCSNLVAMDSNGFSDPYVKIYLKPDKDKKTKHKTKVKPKTLNPVFNEEFFYPIKLAELTKKTLDVSVWDKDFRKNDYIGSVEFGPDSGAPELRHWLDVLKKSNEMIEHWHVLKDVTNAKNTKQQHTST